MLIMNLDKMFRFLLLAFLQWALISLPCSAQRRQPRPREATWTLNVRNYEVKENYDVGTVSSESGVEMTFDFGKCPAYVSGGVSVSVSIWHEKDIFNPAHGSFINGARNLTWSRLTPVYFPVLDEDPEVLMWMSYDPEVYKTHEEMYISRYSPDWSPIKIRIPWSIVHHWDLPDPPEGVYDLPVRYFLRYTVAYEGHIWSSSKPGAVTPTVTCYHYSKPSTPRHEYEVIDLGSEDLTSLFDEEPQEPEERKYTPEGNDSTPQRRWPPIPTRKPNREGRDEGQNGGKNASPHIHVFNNYKKACYAPEYLLRNVRVKKSLPDTLRMFIGGLEPILLVLYDNSYYMMTNPLTPRQFPASSVPGLDAFATEIDTIAYTEMPFNLAHCIIAYLNDSIQQEKLPKLEFDLPKKDDVIRHSILGEHELLEEYETGNVLSADGALYLVAYVAENGEVIVQKPYWKVTMVAHFECDCGKKSPRTYRHYYTFNSEEAARRFIGSNSQ